MAPWLQPGGGGAARAPFAAAAGAGSCLVLQPDGWVCWNAALRDASRARARVCVHFLLCCQPLHMARHTGGQQPAASQCRPTCGRHRSCRTAASCMHRVYYRAPRIPAARQNTQTYTRTRANTRRSMRTAPPPSLHHRCQTQKHRPDAAMQTCSTEQKHYHHHYTGGHYQAASACTQFITGAPAARQRTQTHTRRIYRTETLPSLHCRQTQKHAPDVAMQTCSTELRHHHHHTTTAKCKRGRTHLKLPCRRSCHSAWF